MTAARARTWLLRAWVTLVFGFLLLPVVVIVLLAVSLWRETRKHGR